MLRLRPVGGPRAWRSKADRRSHPGERRESAAHWPQLVPPGAPSYPVAGLRWTPRRPHPRSAGAGVQIWVRGRYRKRRARASSSAGWSTSRILAVTDSPVTVTVTEPCLAGLPAAAAARRSRCIVKDSRTVLFGSYPFTGLRRLVCCEHEVLDLAPSAVPGLAGRFPSASDGRFLEMLAHALPIIRSPRPGAPRRRPALAVVRSASVEPSDGATPRHHGSFIVQRNLVRALLRLS